MSEHYSGHHEHFVAVDCIIFGFDRQKLKLLCIKRNFEPGMGQWSLMGGFLNGDESLDDAAERVLFELTGLKNIYLEQLQAFGKIGRDPAGRVISVPYYALINTSKFNDINSRRYSGKWFELDHLPDLIFDHKDMVSRALKRLRRRCSTQPVGFELLPAKFTLPQLMILYEAIFQQTFDKRNFRKKMLSFGVLDKLEEKDMTGSRKGAFLYKFDKKKYDALIKGGSQFTF